jgi:hypothetical protein
LTLDFMRTGLFARVELRYFRGCRRQPFALDFMDAALFARVQLRDFGVATPVPAEEEKGEGDEEQAG